MTSSAGARGGAAASEVLDKMRKSIIQSSRVDDDADRGDDDEDNSAEVWQWDMDHGDWGGDGE